MLTTYLRAVISTSYLKARELRNLTTMMLMRVKVMMRKTSRAR